MKVLVIHGPNLNLLGSRELSVYGTATLNDVDDVIKKSAAELGCEVEIHQTAREGEIIELLHGAIKDVGGAVLNPAAYAHTSRAIADAIRAVPFPVIEVHLSNIHAREPWRRHSVTAEAARGIVCGLGSQSYVAALRALVEMSADD
ncbi:MAG: 3-dehydroquinate dehydratase [Actinomycetota bacterium]|jgi:3-dehydroquinate dehydratase-2|nr:3-dehydroquinate dehydratase [Actinomycetota bacterium]MEA2487218.1 3-dehydroquinate dehydratase [Actinomycetota bacterium]